MNGKNDCNSRKSSRRKKIRRSTRCSYTKTDRQPDNRRRLVRYVRGSNEIYPTRETTASPHSVLTVKPLFAAAKSAFFFCLFLPTTFLRFVVAGVVVI